MQDKIAAQDKDRVFDTIVKWVTKTQGNVNFSLCRQGAPGDTFMAQGDCTPFTPSGRFGQLSSRPVGTPAAANAYFDNFGGQAAQLVQIPCTFSFDLNESKVSMAGAFPNIPQQVSFAARYTREFVADGGRNFLFASSSESDEAGYVLALQLVGDS